MLKRVGLDGNDGRNMPENVTFVETPGGFLAPSNIAPNRLQKSYSPRVYTRSITVF